MTCCAIQARAAANEAESRKRSKFASLTDWFDFQPIAVETSGVFDESTLVFLRNLGSHVRIPYVDVVVVVVNFIKHQNRAITGELVAARAAPSYQYAMVLVIRDANVAATTNLVGCCERQRHLNCNVLSPLFLAPRVMIIFVTQCVTLNNNITYEAAVSSEKE